jgi:hypothetical protein
VTVEEWEASVLSQSVAIITSALNGPSRVMPRKCSAHSLKNTEKLKEKGGRGGEKSKIVLPLCGRKFRHVNVGIMSTTLQCIQGFKKENRLQRPVFF